MKRRFRQKQDQEPKNDPERDKGVSKDSTGENVDIDDVIKDIDTCLEAEQEASKDGED